MSREIMDERTSGLILEAANRLRDAQIFEGKTKRPLGVIAVPIDLSTARLETDPMPVNFPFKSIFVESATDVSVSIKMKVSTRDSYQGAFNLKLKDSWISDEMVSEAYLHWDAQAGKEITLMFFVGSEFHSGSQISQNSGGVGISEGSSVAGPTQVTLTAATATEILPQDLTRQVSTLQNKTGGTLYIGDATVTDSGATEGIALAPNAILQWRNTGALYGYSTAGGNVSYITES